MSLKQKKLLQQSVMLLCAVILLGGALYAGNWFFERSRIVEKNERYSQLYQPDANRVSLTDSTLPAVADEPIPTPDSGTLIISLPTAPPVQESFGDLLSLNPETVGFLRIDGVLSLPVVQREYDNAFYLTHSFDLAEADEGTLFLDGMNRLVPEDDCLIVYGHNMHNGSMFGELDHYDELDFLKAHPLVQFDTIYENRTYVPFAAFPASMDPESGSYFDLRQIVFTDETFDLFISRLKSRSVLEIPVDACYGDPLLLLVTCDYTKDDGRFIVALRQLRAKESADEAIATVNKAK